MGEMWPLAYLIGAVEHISSSPSLEPGGKNLTVCQYQVILSRPAHPRALQITHWRTFFVFFWTRPGPKGLQHTCEYRVCVVIAARSLTEKKNKTKNLQKHLRHSNWKRDTLRDQIECSIYIYDTTTRFSGDADLFMWRWAR